MRNPVEVNGVTYNSYFKHINRASVKRSFSDYIELMDNCIRDAAIRGQIVDQYHSERFVHPVYGEDFNGCTVCVIEDEDRNEIARGYAFCSMDDNFCKKEGRAKSLGRAIKEVKNASL